MNRSPDVERVLREFFADDGAAAPDYILDVVEARISGQGQRRSWRLLRRLPMSPLIKLGAAAAAILVVAVVGWQLLPRDNDIGGPGQSAQPSASLRPTASARPTASSCAPGNSTCIGVLAPGTHHTGSFSQPFSFTVPAGWSKPLDVEGSVNLQPSSDPVIPSAPLRLIAINPDWLAANKTECNDQPEPGAGATVGDLIDSVTSDPNLIVSTPTATSIGGFTGQELELSVDPAATPPCPTVQLFTHVGTLNDGGFWDITASGRIKLIVLDAGGGHTITIIIQTAQPDTYAAFLAAATPIVESFAYELGLAPS